MQRPGYILDQRTLVAASATLMDESLLDMVIRPCVQDLPRDEAMSCLLELLMRHSGCSLGNLPYWDWSCWDLRTNALMNMAVDLLERTGHRKTHVKDQALLIRVLYNYFGGFMAYKIGNDSGKAQSLYSRFMDTIKSSPERNLMDVPPSMIKELMEKASNTYPPDEER